MADIGKVVSDRWSDKPFLVAALGNLALAAFKIAFGLFAYNRLILMDGLFSLMASGACLLPWQAEALDRRVPDERRPYGMGKILFLSMAGVGALGLVIAIHMFLYSLTIVGWLRMHPSRILSLMVAVISILANHILYRYLVEKSKARPNGMVLTAAGYNRLGVRISVLVLVLLILPLLNITAVEGPGVAIVSIIVFVVAMKMIYNGFAGIMDKAPSKKITQAITACAEKTSGVKEVVTVNARYVGMLLHIDMSIAVDEKINMEQAHLIAQDVKAKLMDRIPAAREVNVIIA